MYQRLFKNSPKQFLIEIVKVSIGTSYIRLGDYKKAFQYLQNVYEMRNEIYQYEDNYFLFYSNLSSLTYYYE